MTDIVLRPADDDAALTAIAALARRIWREHYPGIISHAQIDYMLTQGYALPVMRREIEDGVRYVLAEADGDPAGFAAHGPDAGDEDTLWLHKLYVAGEHRGRGLARRLLDDALAHARARGADRVRLRVNRHNRVAVEAYRRLGFRIESTDIKDIGGGFVMDDYLMGRAAAQGG
ncbi:N-acetyltransferase GCN5 [Salinisphaera sp. PC39]|uniref:GNAT family N-acetyltransferase n=1 Tax=Salinisphaera sp. PC39 TaxID=1304156 RepID=UPI00333E3184